MVWFYNYKKKKMEYETNLVKARAKAVKLLEGQDIGHVDFFKKRTSRNLYAYVGKHKQIDGTVELDWSIWYPKKGQVISKPIYKNGKLKR